MIEYLLHANASACVLEHEALLLRKNEGMRAQCLNDAMTVVVMKVMLMSLIKMMMMVMTTTMTMPCASAAVCSAALAEVSERRATTGSSCTCTNPENTIAKCRRVARSRCKNRRLLASAIYVYA